MSATIPVRHREPTERTWWEATKESWSRPREWGSGMVALLGTLVLLLAFTAWWVTRPGQILGATATLPASAAYSSDADGHYVYKLQAPDVSKERLRATLQSIYGRHKRATAGKPVTIVLLQRTGDADPFILGRGDPAGPDVVGRISAGADRKEAVVRDDSSKPFESVKLRW